MTTVQGFFRWLTRQQHLASNPAADLELPRLTRRLPRAVLTAGEVEKILAVPRVEATDGLRDRAVLEVLYSTGMRRSELCHLLLADLDFTRSTVFIREGKGRKDRMIPLGRRAIHWLHRYLENSRAHLLTARSGPEQAVFLSASGRRLSSGVLGQLVHQYVDRSRIGKTGSCHLFRHAMATLMLEGGADIRYIQHILATRGVDYMANGLYAMFTGNIDDGGTFAADYVHELVGLDTHWAEFALDLPIIVTGVSDLAKAVGPALKARSLSVLQQVKNLFLKASSNSNSAAAKNIDTFWAGPEAGAAARAWSRANDGNILNLPPTASRAEITSASLEAARNASGEIHVFQSASGVQLSSTFVDEGRVLMANPNVTGVTYHIVLPDGTIQLLHYP